jgi:hypothetical protein
VEEAGLPDGLFSKPKSQCGQLFEGLRLKNVDIFYGHLELLTGIWDILWSFGTFFTVSVSGKPGKKRRQHNAFFAAWGVARKTIGQLLSLFSETHSGLKLLYSSTYLLKDGSY